MVNIDTEYKKTEYMNPSQIGAPLLSKPPPSWRPKKKQSIIDWINEQKHAKLLRILIVVCIGMLFVGFMLWGISHVMQGYATGGTKESDSRLAHFLGSLTLKFASVPVSPI